MIPKQGILNNRLINDSVVEIAALFVCYLIFEIDWFAAYLVYIVFTFFSTIWYMENSRNDDETIIRYREVLYWIKFLITVLMLQFLREVVG